jgi:hypothetical protein
MMHAETSELRAQLDRRTREVRELNQMLKAWEAMRHSKVGLYKLDSVCVWNTTTSCYAELNPAYPSCYAEFISVYPQLESAWFQPLNL